MTDVRGGGVRPVAGTATVSGVRRRTDPPQIASPAGAADVTHAARSRRTLGGLVPVAGEARDGSACVFVPCLELHSGGAVLPLAILSDVPGVLRWSAEEGLSATDDLGTRYRAVPLAAQSGLGALLRTLWLTPAVPPGAREITLSVDGVRRVSVPRGGAGVVRPLTGGPWPVRIDLSPARTAAPPPPEPAAGLPAATVAGTPTRALEAYEGRIPVGQARVRPGAALCLWAIERYGDRAVLTLCLLHDGAPLSWGGEVEVWDDRGGAYVCAPMQEVARDAWTEVAVEVRPGIDPAAGALAVRVTGAAGDGDLAGPAVFGVRVGDRG